MRLREDADSLIVEDSGTVLSVALYVFVAGGCVLVGRALLGADGRARLGLIVSGGFMLLCAALLSRTSRFVFDRARRVVTWQRRRLVSRSSGRIAFDDVRDVVVETMTDIGEGASYRLALATASRPIPLSDGYGPGLAQYDALRDRIAAVIGRRPASATGTAEPAPGEADLRELVRQRRILDAVALLRAREPMSLGEARQRIAEIEAQVSAERR